MKRPSFQFYPADWRKDPALRSCSLAARGLWMECMCIAHESEPYGHLQVNGAPMTVLQIARGVGEGERRTAALLAELEAAGVYSRAENGAIYSRRMVHDEHIRTVRAHAGTAGWRAKGGERSGGRFAQAKDDGASEFAQANGEFCLSKSPRDHLPEAKQNTAPSSSTSVYPLNPHGANGNGKTRRRRQRLPATPCPESFEVTDGMSAWAIEQGLPGDRVMPETAAFLRHHKAKGNMFAQWDQAWSKWIVKAVEFGAKR